MNLTRIVLVATFVSLNVGLAKVANLLSLPIYLDTPGTILAAAILPPVWAIVTAVLSSLLGAVVINAVWLYYVGTQIVIALIVIAALRSGLLSSWWKALLTGILVGLAAAVSSAPVTVLVFGGVTVPGPTAINALLIAAGRTLWESVLAGSLLIELVDKPLATLLAWLILERLPGFVRDSGNDRIQNS